jgi:hypothetical protein
MTKTREELMALYWERPEYRHAWQLCFEKAKIRRPLLIELLEHLPAYLGTCDFVEDHPSREFDLLVTYDEDDDGALKNAMYIFSILAVTNATRFIGAEGAWGRVVVEWLRVFPDPQVRNELTMQLLSEREIAPHEAAAIMVDHEANPVIVWGIEDKDLYLRVREKYRQRAPDLHKLLDKRASIMVRNLLSEQKKRGADIAVGSVTLANYWAARRLLEKQRIAHAGIRADASGPAQPGLLDKLLRGEVKRKADEFAEAIAGPMGTPTASADIHDRRRLPRWRRSKRA